MHERDVFLAAVEITDPAARQAYLDQACAGDENLRAQVDALLRAHADPGSFLGTPALEQLAGQRPRDPAAVDNSAGPTGLSGDVSDPGHQATQRFAPQDPDGRLSGLLTPSVMIGSLGRLGHYEVQQVLGSGGFGTVARAFDDKLHRTVAIKLMSAELAATSPARKRFLREARASAAIRHDNVVDIYSVEEDPLPYLVMEYIPGQTLEQKLNDHGPLDVADVLRLGQQLANGLAAAHAIGLIHRDIKPANILLEAGIEERIKITDFGLARAVDDATLSQSGVVAGTPMYMAPEQANGQPLDQRADLFSLGSVLYQMVSGRPPFRAETTLAVLRRVSDDTPRPIQEIIPETPACLCAIISRLHAKRPGDRIQTARELADLLGQCRKAVERGIEPQFPWSVPASPQPGDSAQPSVPAGASISAVPVRAPRRARRRFVAAAAILAMLLLGLATIFTIKSSDGTLVIESDDPEVRIVVDGGGRQFHTKGGEELRLRPGSYSVTARRGAVVVKQSRVTITRGAGQMLRIETADAKPVVPVSAAIPSDLPTVAADPAPSVAPTQVPLDLTPPAPLGTWEMGPEPPWFQRGAFDKPYFIDGAEVLPGVIVRPARIAGIKRWNVDTALSRGSVTAARWSPDGKRLATGSSDGHVRIFEAESLELQCLLPGIDQSGIEDLAWSPDSLKLAVAGESVRAFRLPSLGTGVEFARIPQSQAVAWSANGKFMAVGGVDGLRLYNANGSVAKTPGAGNRIGCARAAIAWSPDDQRIVCCHFDNTVRIWNASAEAEEAEVLATDIDHRFFRLAWGSGDWIALGDRKTLRLYNPERQLDHSVAYDGGFYNALVWHPNGTNIFFADGTSLKEWDCTRKAVIATIPTAFPRFTSTSPVGLDCTAGGERLVAGMRSIRVYKPGVSDVLHETPETFASVQGLDWRSDGQRLASAGGPNERGVRLWSSTGAAAGQFVPRGTADDLIRIKWSPVEDVLIGVGLASGVWLSRPSGEMKQVLSVGSLSAAWSKDGHYVAVGTPDHVVVLDRLGLPVADMPAGEGYAHVAWSQATNFLAVGCGKHIQICNPQAGWILKPWEQSKWLPIYSPGVVWSPDGELLSTGVNWYTRDGKQVSDDHRRAHAFDWRPDGLQYLGLYRGIGLMLPGGTPVATRAIDGGGSSNTLKMRWHPSGQLIATGSASGVITAWSAENLQPHWHAVLLPEQKSATFSGAGELLDGDPETVEKCLVYYLERDDGGIETLKPSEFQKLLSVAD